MLRQRAGEVADIDGKLARLADDMLTTMYEAPGLGLAAPQVGVQKRIFVYDVGEGPQVVINPEIRESRGEWAFDEGCLSIPGLAFELIRPKELHLVGYDLEGNELSIEADELLARCFQHELDHLDGVLFIERLDDDDRKAAMKIIREQKLTAADLANAEVGGAASAGDRLQPSLTLRPCPSPPRPPARSGGSPTWARPTSRSRRSGPWSRPASRWRSSCRSPTDGGGGAAASCRRR